MRRAGARARGARFGRPAAAGLLSAAALAAAAVPARAQDAPEERPSYLALAAQLRAAGSYAECAVEALRHAYVRPDEKEVGFERAALCLALARRFADGRRLMLALDASGASLSARGRLRLCLLEVFVGGVASPVCDRAAAGAGTDEVLGLVAYTPVMRALHAGRWQEARQRLARADGAAAGPTLVAWRARDRALLDREQSLPRKSPWIAGALSAVIPGLGRVYLGRWQDGVLSFLLVGAASALATHGFVVDGKSSVRGWVLGTTAAVFYVGNIYGSAVGALVQRRDREDDLLREVDREYIGRLDP